MECVVCVVWCALRGVRGVRCVVCGVLCVVRGVWFVVFIWLVNNVGDKYSPMHHPDI
jgi:hypothetical protein